MRTANRIHSILCISCALAMFASAYAAEDPALVEARQKFLREMKSKFPEARVQAVASFGKVASVEVIEVLLKRGLQETEPSVRKAVRQVLREKGSDPAIHKFLTAEFARNTKKPDREELLSGLLGGMVATEVPAEIDEAVKVLDEYLASPKGHLIVPMSLIDDLGMEGGKEAVRIIANLTKIKPFQNQFGYRRCVVQAMTRIQDPAAVGFLVEMLPGAYGLVQAEIIEHLTRVTKQKHKDNDREWTKWWTENKATFTFPERVAAEEPVDPKQSTYYGIPICAKRIVFVLDTSGSMRGYPMEAAKMALLKTVESLPESVSFDMVLFDKTAAVWQPRLLPATLQAKQMAAQTVIARGMSMGTASHAALNAAFSLDPEVIYFLSDGEPTDGNPSQIIESMSERNRTRRISIHTIGVVTQKGGGAGLTFFMKPLAEHNYGSFRLVE